MHRLSAALALAAYFTAQPAAQTLSQTANTGKIPEGQHGTVHTPDVDLATFTFAAPAHTTRIPVIAVNGGPGLSHIYMLQNNMWPTVARTRTVVFYDQRGTGGSQHLRPSAPQTMEAQVADLEAVRASLHVEKVDLVGDSYGGLLVSAYAAAHPEHVNTLVLSDSAAPGFAKLHPRLSEAFPDVIAHEKEQVDRLTDPEAKAQAGFDAHMHMMFYSAANRDRYLAGAKDLGLVPATGEAVSNAIEKLDLTPQMAQFHFPTLVLNGRFDLNVTPDVAWAVAHNITGAQLVWFEKSGHLPSYEEPEKYRQVIETFFAAHEPASAR